MRTQAAVADATPARRLRDALEPVAMHAVWAEPVDTATGRATVKPHACLEADGLIADRAITEKGRAFRDGIEAATDAAQRDLVEAVGDAFDDVTTQLDAWSQRCVEAYAFPVYPRKRAAG
jgi:hypothetical protein